MYPVEAQDADPIRTDAVLGGRYTSWARPQGSRTYVVREGETMAGLAKRFFGDERRWHLIADFNPHIYKPLALKEGDEIVIPPASLFGLNRSKI